MAAGARSGRLVLATTRKPSLPYVDFAFADPDTVIFRERKRGRARAVHRSADARILVPMREGLRSLNVALAAAMIAGEALRQTGRLPGMARPLAREAQRV